MKLSHTHDVNASVDDLYAAFTDPYRIGEAFPGAAVTEVDGDEFVGRLTTKVGPFTLTYDGTGRMTVQDPERHAAALEAEGGEKRGFGRASLASAVDLTPLGPERTRIHLDTTIEVMGSPVDLGGGLAQRLSDPLVERFMLTMAGEAPAEDELDVTRSVVDGLFAPAGRSVARFLRRR